MVASAFLVIEVWIYNDKGGGCLYSRKRASLRVDCGAPTGSRWNDVVWALGILVVAAPVLQRKLCTNMIL